MGKLACLVSLLAADLLAQTPPRTAAALPDWVQREADIAYDRYPETVLDVLIPKTAPAKNRPGVIVIHGGGWVGGSRDAMIRNFCLPYLEKGFVVANVEYRLAKVAPAPAAVADVLRAADWFRRNAKRFQVNPNRIVVTGGSAGGHLALMVGLTPKSAGLGPPAKVAAVINFYGITDVADQLSGPNRREYAVTWVPEQDGRLELARRVSPITYVRKNVPPVLTIHGDADPTVPYEHGVRLTRALREAGADAELLSIRGGKHGGFSPEQMASIYNEIFRFLQSRRIIGPQ
jgi:acetyl esterase/lipase